MSQVNIETGLAINKETAIKMASEVFGVKKRATVVCIRSYNKLIKLSYKGPRSDESAIRTSVAVVSVLKMKNREVASYESK